MNALLCSLKFFATVALDTLLAQEKPGETDEGYSSPAWYTLVEDQRFILRVAGTIFGKAAISDSKVAEMPCLGLYELN